MEMVSKFYDKLLARQSLSSWFCVILGSVIRLLDSCCS